MTFIMFKKALPFGKRKLFFKDHCSNSSWPFKSISCFTTAHTSETLTDILLGPAHQLRFTPPTSASFQSTIIDSLDPPGAYDTILAPALPHHILLPVVSYPLSLNSFHPVLLHDWLDSRAHVHSSPYLSTSFGTQQ